MSTVKSYFDKEGHQHVYHNDPELYKFIVQFLKNGNLNNKNPKVLDFGCGDGAFIKSLLNSKVNAEYYGTDISETMIQMANRNIKNTSVNLFVSDGFNMPFSQSLKFDIIHLDSVIHHIVSSSIPKTKTLVNSILKLLFDKLNAGGILILEEMYYNSYIIPSISSTIIFYGLKFFNLTNLDISKIIKEYHKGLEVRFLHDNEIFKLLKTYGEPTLIKRIPWKIPNSYKVFLLKSVGHVTYAVSAKQ